MPQTPESGIIEASLEELASVMPQDVYRVESLFQPYVTVKREKSGAILIEIDWTDSYQGAMSLTTDGGLIEEEETIEGANGYPYEVGAEIMDRIMLGDELSFANRNRTILYENQTARGDGAAGQGGGK